MKASGNWLRDRGTHFYRIAALLAPLVAVAGFWLTYLQPMAERRFSGPASAHGHGALLAGWLLLVVIQAWLIPGGLKVHRKLGWLAVLLAPAVAVSTFMVGLEAADRDIARYGPDAAASLAGNTTAPLIFLVLVAAAIWRRRDPQWHKRFIVVATVAMLWPAWFRWRHFLPWVPQPDITLGLVVADLPIVIAMLRDRVRFGAIHPAYLWAGLPLIAEQSLESFLFASGNPGWTAFGLTIYDLVR
ncbi:MAG: hypothetical protein ACKOPM_03805 [Novosphingobium sp.]